MAKHGNASFVECWYGKKPDGRPCRNTVVGVKAVIEAAGVCPKCGAPLPSARPALTLVVNKGAK